VSRITKRHLTSPLASISATCSNLNHLEIIKYTYRIHYAMNLNMHSFLFFFFEGLGTQVCFHLELINFEYMNITGRRRGSFEGFCLMVATYTGQNKQNIPNVQVSNGRQTQNEDASCLRSHSHCNRLDLFSIRN
jgi:hypothetical protein